MGLREADALSGGSYGPNAVGVFCTLQSKAVNGICVRANEEEDRKTDNPSEQPCRTRVMTLQTAHCRDLLFIPRCFCSCANRMSLDFCRVLNVRCCRRQS